MSNFLTKHSFNSQKMSTFANMKCRLIPDVSCRENQHLAIFSQNLLILNNLGGGIVRLINRSTYFDFTQHKYSHLTCSDATRGHLMDSLCPVDEDQLYQNSM